MVFALVMGGIVIPAAITIWLAIEQHDKNTRAKKGLPPRKYHDITDKDVTIIYTIEEKHRHR